MSQDIFVPTSSPDDALVEQLHTVTFITADKDATERAFVQGYGLESSGWARPDSAEATKLKSYFGFDADNDFEVCCYSKSGIGSNIQIRAICTDTSVPQSRPEYDGLLVGGATISFPKPDLHEHEKQMMAAGFKSTIGVKEMEFESPTGEVYISAETIYYGPENAYLLAVKRPDIFVPVGPMDPDSGVGGAAYSARCVDNSEEILAFIKDVLKFEIRRDVSFEIGDKSALLLPKGANERFIQAFAPGSSTAYIVIMDHGEHNKTSSTEKLGSPSRGIAMWSFRATDLDEVHRRAIASNTKILSGPEHFESPFLGSKRTLLLEDPGGFPIEVFEA